MQKVLKSQRGYTTTINIDGVDLTIIADVIQEYVPATSTTPAIKPEFKVIKLKSGFDDLTGIFNSLSGCSMITDALSRKYINSIEEINNYAR